MFAKRFLRALAVTTVASLVMATTAVASDVDVAVVDVVVPTNSVTLSPGATGSIAINMSVTGNQAGTATFEVYRDWTLSGGAFSGSNPQEFTVGPRGGGDPATTFSTSGTITVATGQAPGTFTLAVAAFDITNSNTTGAKLAAGDPSAYQVSVLAPSDASGPQITPSVSGTLGTNGWYVSDVTVSWDVSDPESPITSTAGCSTTVITTDTAGTALTCSATSAGGTSSQSVTIKRDATAPEVNPGSIHDATWRNSELSGDFTSTDGGSGLADAADASFRLTASAESIDGSTPTTATRTVYDNAGNSTTRSVAAFIDLTKPTISGSAGPSSPDGANGWYVTAPTVTFTCGDALSGIASCLADGETTASKTLDESASAQSVGGTATDNAGNTEATTVSGLYVDLTNPTNVQFVGGPAAGSSHYFGSVPAAPQCTADDAVSGVASCVVTGYRTDAGTHTMTATATDEAGRTATASRSYTVLAWDLSGFYSPVRMSASDDREDRVWNVVKGGSTVPLKFEVFADAELTDTSVVTGFFALRIGCDLDGADDPVDFVTTGKTALRYDTTEGQFIQNWQTPRELGKCFLVRMTTADGSELTAYFRLK